MLQAHAAIDITRISGAMTNLVFLAHNSAISGESAKVIIRVFGSGSILFSRHQERGIFLAASHLGVGPQCLVEFSNGRVEQFLPGTSVTAATMRQQDVAAAIAAALADFHVRMFQALPFTQESSETQVHGDSPRSNESGLCNALWDRLRGWLQSVANVAPDSAAELGVSGAAAEEEIATMERIAEKEWGPCWLAFTHNDLQYGNVLLCSANGEEGGIHEGNRESVVACLIDYEYSTFGDVAFDIANHFCEYAADYHAANEAQVLDWRRLSSSTERAFFCKAYCESLLRRHPESPLASIARAAAAGNGSGIPPLTTTAAGGALASSSLTISQEDKLIEQMAGVLAARVEAFLPLSHLKWGLWGLIQSKLSDVGFNYLGYAESRLRQYHETKKVLLTERKKATAPSVGMTTENGVS